MRGFFFNFFDKIIAALEERSPCSADLGTSNEMVISASSGILVTAVLNAE